MKRALIILFVLMLSSSIVKAEEMKGSGHEMKGSGMDPEQEAMMAKWQEFATPADGHTILNSITSWMISFFFRLINIISDLS